MENGRAVIIAGASGGLGPAIVKAYYAFGDNVVLAGQSMDGLQAVKTELNLDNERSLLVAGDQTSPNDVKDLVNKANERFGSIDVLVNVTGGFRAGTVESTEPKSWDFMIALNLNAAFYAANAVLPSMIDQGRGKLIFISAKPGESFTGGVTAYSVSKAALNAMIKNMAAEISGRGVTANAVAPATLDTPANREAMPNADTSKWVTPEALANVITFLSSDAADDINGAIVPVYGS